MTRYNYVPAEFPTQWESIRHYGTVEKESHDAWQYAFKETAYQNDLRATFAILENDNVDALLTPNAMRYLGYLTEENEAIGHYDLELYRTGFECWIKHVALNAPMGDVRFNPGYEGYVDDNMVYHFLSGTPV